MRESSEETQIKKLLVSAAAAALVVASPAFATGDLSRANVQKIEMEMGTNDNGEMYFKPNDLTFETGQAYDWVLTNVDDTKHEIAVGEMLERIFTRKVEIETTDGELVAEIKGNVHEIEIGPHQTVHWFFVPVQDDDDPIEIACELPGHVEAGMHGIVHLH